MTLNSIDQKLNIPSILQQIPHTTDGRLCGAIDLATMTRMIWRDEDMQTDGKVVKISPMSRDDRSFDLAMEARRSLVERVADLDDEFAEAYLSLEDSIKMRPDVIKAALRRITLSRKGLPVFVGSALKNIGLQPLMDGVNDLLPSPLDVNRPFLRFYSNHHLCAMAFKVIHHPNKGPLTFFRVYSGELKLGSVFNFNEEAEEKVASLFLAFADELVPVTSVLAGNIGVASGLVFTKAGDAITNYSDIRAIKMKSQNLQMSKGGENDMKTGEGDWTSLKMALPSIKVPDPVFFCSIEPPSLGAINDLEKALERLKREDPSLRVKVDEETNQTILSGMGELHLEIILDRIRREYKVDASLGPLEMVYKEEVVGPSKETPITETYVFDRVMNGKRNYVGITLSLYQGDDTKLNSSQFINCPDIDTPVFIREKQVETSQHGIKSALNSGPLLGFPVSQASFKVENITTMGKVVPSALSAAAASCARNALKKANVILLEPVMNLELSVEPVYCDVVQSDLARRRGVVSDRFATDFIATIQAKVPLAEMLGYSTSIRTLTSGTASFTMELAEYQEMSKADSDVIIEEVNRRGWR